jgi:hypothetical protein
MAKTKQKRELIPVTVYLKADEKRKVEQAAARTNRSMSNYLKFRALEDCDEK